ncbi:MAG: protein kinase [Polyangiaceae bacterium]|nr:protein kinase [Polyangiaceae bacterium]
MHARGILHRDIKPANVLLMLDPPDPMRAVLADLGVATPEAEQGQLTATHEVVGTPAYRAPESLMGKHTAASDVYAFGKTIEFVFARGLPSGMGPGQCSRSPIFSSQLWDCLDEVLRKACSFDPAQRFQNASELFNALPEGMIVRSVPGKNCRRGRTPRLLALRSSRSYK